MQLYLDDGKHPLAPVSLFIYLFIHSFDNECFLCAKFCATARDTDVNKIQSTISQISYL